MRLLLLVFLVVMTACKDTQADTDVGLYDPVAPAGSSFVRFMNLNDGKTIPQIGKKKYEAIEAGQVSAYFPVPEGNITAEMSDDKAVDQITAGRFYTIIRRGKLFTLEDQGALNRAKAVIAFYNFSDRDSLSLKVRSGTVDVLKDVRKNKTLSREMNAVKIDFSIFDGAENLMSLEETVLERGNHYSIIYDGTNAQIVTATTNTRK